MYEIRNNLEIDGGTKGHRKRFRLEINCQSKSKEVTTSHLMTWSMRNLIINDRPTHRYKPNKVCINRLKTTIMWSGRISKGRDG